MPALHVGTVFDLWTLPFALCTLTSPATNEWDRLEMQHMHRIKGRRSHVAAAFGCSVIYFGGYNAVTKQHFGDLYMANIGRFFERVKSLLD